MKFPGGFWNIRDCYQAFYASQAYSIENSENLLTFLSSTKRISNRGDTANTPLNTTQFSSPLENVIRVRIFHPKGGIPRKPVYQFEARPIIHLQLFIRENTIISIGMNDRVPVYNYANGITFHVFNLAEDKAISVTVPGLDGRPACTAKL